MHLIPLSLRQSFCLSRRFRFSTLTRPARLLSPFCDYGDVGNAGVELRSETYSTRKGLREGNFFSVAYKLSAVKFRARKAQQEKDSVRVPLVSKVVVSYFQERRLLPYVDCTPLTAGHVYAGGLQNYHRKASGELQPFRLFSQLAGQDSLREKNAPTDTGTSGSDEGKEENFLAVDLHARNCEEFDLCMSGQELEKTDVNNPITQSNTEDDSLQFPSSEDLMNSELQKTQEYLETSESQLQGSKALSLNDLLHTLNSIEKSDDLNAKLSPFNGRISTQDATTVMKLLEDKRLCFSFYIWMKRQSAYTPDLTFLLTVVRSLVQMSKWDRLVHVTQDLFDAGFVMDNSTYCRIIQDASLQRKVSVSEWWFQKMKERGCWPDRQTYNTMIHAYALAWLPEKAFATFDEMVERDVRPDISTFCHLLIACQNKGDPELAHNYFLQIGNYGLIPDLVAYTILLDTYGKQGKATEAGELFREMQRVGITPDAKAYNSLIFAYGKAGMMDQATSTFNEYQKEAGQNPDKIVFWTMLRLYSQAGLLQQALSVKKMMRVAQIPVDGSCYFNLIDGFRRKEQWEDAIRGFKEMQRYKYPIDARTYEMMMKIFTKAGHHVDCERVFDQLMRKGYTKEILPYEIMMNVYKRTNNLTNASRIYELAKRNGCRPNRNMCNSLIYMYAKAGMLPACEKIVREMQGSRIEPNKNTFLSLIKAYAAYGQYDSARDVYTVMRETGLQPDYELAELMVEVFVKVGEVQEAQILLKELVDAGISPSKRMVTTVEEAGGAAVVPGESSGS
ncbi:hypothetical protein R1flu_004607 [Riccia fluitans]|uniref:PROP1-like PPR domain-containing protein n=1 Tax=Riccia fluitans TaxID=41844 RepID=A0ABD1YRE5_9MARC